MEYDPATHTLEYNLELGQTKPDTVHRDASYCPFCDVKNLKKIMETRGHMIWLENAYPVLKDSWQTLIIETNDCDGEFAEYTPEYATELVSFGLEKWQQVKATGRFRSVAFYRNHGYMSGGTIHHPHSQIVGFKNYDYHEDVKLYHLLGKPIIRDGGLEINLSSRPIIGFYEVNLLLSNRDQLPEFVRSMQIVAHYFINDFVWRNESYNIFFYDFPDDDRLFVKIVPRFLTNPLYVGYMIAQVANDGHQQHVIKKLQEALAERK